MKRGLLVAVMGVVVVALSAMLFGGCAAAPTEAKTIKIGVLTPMKLAFGKASWWAATIAAEEINEAGGVDVGGVKYDIELVSADSNEYASVTDATAAMERLLTVNKVDFVLGGYRSEATLAMLELAADYKTIMMSAGQAHAKPNEMVHENYDRYKYWFRPGPVNIVAYTDTMVGGAVEALVEKMGEEFGIEPEEVRAAYLVEEAIWTVTLCEAYDRIFDKLGATVVGTWKPSPSATDVTAEFTAIRALDVQMIMGGAGGTVAAVIPKAIKELEVPVVFGGVSGGTASYSQWVGTAGGCEYEYTWNMVDLNKISGYFERWGDYPVYTCIDYDSVYIIKEAVERAGTLDTDAVVVAMENTRYTGAAGVVTFSPKEDPVAHMVVTGPELATAYIQQWQAGVPEVIWPDGTAVLGDESWVGVRSSQCKDVQLPPWMVEYWKGKF